MHQHRMVNEEYEPAEEQERILELMKRGRGEGRPWGYTSPAHVRQELDIEKGNDSFHLGQLVTAGWIRKVTRGFYEFVDDPREE